MKTEKIKDTGWFYYRECETDIYESGNDALIKVFVETGFTNREVAKECISEMDFNWYFGETEVVEED